MSRSYKKHPYCTDKQANISKEKKRVANSTVRNKLKDPDFEIQNSDYKKVYPSYDLCDFKYTQTWEEYWKTIWDRYQMHGGNEPNKKEEYRKWKQLYVSK